MVAVVGYLIAAGVATVVACLIARRDGTVPRDPSVDLGALAGRNLVIIGGLAGFAVTAMILIVTIGRNGPEASGTTYTTLLTMFFVAYVGFIAAGLLFANVPAPVATATFDVPGAMFAGAAVTQFFTVGVAWFALVPMFQAFGLVRMAELATWLLPTSSLASYGLIATQLHRSGFLSPRLIVLVPTQALALVAAYAVLAAGLGLRAPESALAITVAGFVVGAPAFAILSCLPVLVHDERLARVVGRFGQVLVVGYAQSAVVLVGFLWLGAAGFA
jgi:hypothetical protein